MQDRLALLGCGQCTVGGGGQFTGAAIALFGVFRHAFGDHRIQSQRDLPGSQLAGTRGRRRQMRADRPFDAVGLIGRRPDQTLDQHTGQCIDVGAIGDLAADEPLRGHVVARSHHRPGVGQSWIGCSAGDTEIHQVGEVVAGDQDVFRFDIAVRHAAGVRGVQRGGDLSHDGHRACRRQRTIGRHHGVQRNAVDQPHVQIELPVELAVIMDRHCMRLGQPSGGVGLALHPLSKHRVGGESLCDQLQRY